MKLKKQNKKLKKEILQLKEKIDTLQEKYNKNNDDKLILAHLLSKINDELDDSLRNEKRFIASVSHELRTPMTSIIGYGELMADTSLDGKQKRYLQSITESSSYLLSLVSDLLDVAKFKDKRVELNPKVIDLHDTLYECATLIQSKISDEVEFEMHLPSLNHKIKADDKRLKQIVINLLSNSAKFTSKGSIKFSVHKIEEIEKNRLQIEIHIEDTGSGISNAVKEKLFDPFFSTDKTQGTGLGLFISQELAELMEGRIRVFSEENKGTLLTFTFIVEKSIKKEIGKGLIDSKILMCSTKDNFLKSLIDELEKINMYGLEHYDVPLHGIETLIAIYLPQANKYDIVIFDMDTFGSDAIYIAKMFTLLNPKLKVVAFTEEESDSNFEMFNFTISKPISHQRFIRKLEKFYLQKTISKNKINQFEHLKILIVEDVKLNRIYEQEMLNNFFKIQCDTAENGAVAVQKVKENEYDAVLMDMRMPIMDGLEATRKIREFNKEIPIICMSANVYIEDKIAAEESGMNDFIEKPLERSDIESKLLKLFSDNDVLNIEVKKHSLSVVAENYLKKNFDEETVEYLLETAKESISESIEKVKELSEEKSYIKLHDEFHLLKGLLSNLGLRDLTQQALLLQDYAKAKDPLVLAEPKNILLKALSTF